MSDAAARRDWRYVAVGEDGRRVSALLSAVSEGAAARALAEQGLTPLSLDAAGEAPAASRAGALRIAERLLILRQLSLLLEAGIDLLEAIGVVAAGLDGGRGRAELEAVGGALARGEPLAQSLEAHARGFPLYVYAMTRVGERTGRVGEVLGRAADQMAYEDRLRRDVLNALTYPTFLLGAGFVAVMFIFTQVVPRFAAMIGERSAAMPEASRVVLSVGLWADAHAPWVLAAAAGVTAGLLVALRNASLRLALYVAARRAPLVGPVLRAREIVGWARLMAFALSNGLPLLDAAALARGTLPPGPLRDGLGQVEGELRAGLSLDAALQRHTPLRPMDLSLLNAGQRAGALPKMLGVLAEGYDDRLRDRLKRLTALVEPIAIGGIALIVGAIALSLVLALSSVYENIG